MKEEVVTIDDQVEIAERVAHPHAMALKGEV
jgi:hypothetical protein